MLHAFAVGGQFLLCHRGSGDWAGGATYLGCHLGSPRAFIPRTSEGFPNKRDQERPVKGGALSEIERRWLAPWSAPGPPATPTHRLRGAPVRSSDRCPKGPQQSWALGAGFLPPRPRLPPFPGEEVGTRCPGRAALSEQVSVGAVLSESRAPGPWWEAPFQAPSNR